MTGLYRPVLGVDADSHFVGFALWVGADSGKQDAWLVRRSNKFGRVYEDYDACLTAAMARAGEVGALVVLEGIHADRKSGRISRHDLETYRKLSEVHGEIKRAARQHGLVVDVCEVTTWHMGMFGVCSGRDEMKRAALDTAAKLGFVDISHHEADALCIAGFGWIRLGGLPNAAAE